MAQGTCSSGSPVPLSGDIKEMTVPWLFQSLRSRSKTGTAVFEHVHGQAAEKAVKKVYFKNGDITFASSNLQENWLGRSLVRAGRLSEQQCMASEELVAKTGKKQGTILVELGFLTPQALVEGVKFQVKQIILGLFRVRMGAYRFDEGPLPMADIIPLQMSTGNVILEGVTSQDWKDIRKTLPPPTAVIRPANDPSCLYQDAQLSQDQLTVLSFVDGKRSIEEICGLSGIGDFNAMKAVYVLLALQMAEEGQLKTEEEMNFAREAVREAVRPKPAEPAKPAEPELVVTKQMLEEAFAALPQQDHFEVLGVDRTATAVQVKKAYFRLAKAYHPDRHFDPAMADMKDRLDALFDRIHKAYEALSDMAKRTGYEQELARRKAEEAQRTAGTGFVEKKAEEYVENYAEKAARAADQFNNGMKDFKSGNYWGAVEAFSWATRLDPLKAPYFFYLGLCLAHVPRRKHEAEEHLSKALEIDPTKVEYHIELSNLYLASGMKPRAVGVLNSALQHVAWKDKIEEALALANEGKPAAVLTGQTAREAQPRAAGTERVSKGKAEEAGKKHDSGMKQFRTGNFGLAVNDLADAARLDPTKAEHHFFLGICLSRISRRKAEAEQSLKKALELDPGTMDHHYELGSYYLRNGQKAKGAGILNNALLRFPDAEKVRSALKAAGVAVAEAAAEEEKKAGLFSRMFKGSK